MARTYSTRWRSEVAPALPWARWSAVAAGCIAILATDPPALWVSLATAPALAIAVIQLGILTHAVVRRPARDREADDRVQVLVDRTCLPDIQLVEVHATEHVSAAGQRALTIDLATGHTRSLWFPQAHFPVGSLVLVEARADAVRPVDWMLTEELRAAYRHRSNRASGRTRSTQVQERRFSRQVARAIPSSSGNAPSPRAGQPDLARTPDIRACAPAHPPLGP